MPVSFMTVQAITDVAAVKQQVASKTGYGDARTKAAGRTQHTTAMCAARLNC